MIKILRKLSILLDSKQKCSMIGIVILMLIAGVLETMSIGILMPVVSVVLDPDAISKYGIPAIIYNGLGLESASQLTTILLIGLVIAFAVKNILLYMQNVVQLRFVYTNQFSTSRRMMINFMKRPYEYYLRADTAVIQRMITSDVNNMYGLILSLLQLSSEIIVFTFIVAILIIVDWKMILTVASLMIVLLLVIKVVLKPIMIQAGKDNQDYYSGLYKWIEQSVMGIKEIKIALKESYFINEYAKCGKGYVDAVQKYAIYNSTPRLLIETVTIAGMVIYLFIFLKSGVSVAKLIPQLSTFAYAAMRLLPSANRINNHLTSISYFEPFFMGVSDNLQNEINDNNIVYDEEAYRKKTDVERLKIEDSLELIDITYKYPETDKLIFEEANMSIPIGSAVGIVGTSGSGKTTIVDILLGLLEIESGSILADGVEVREHYHEWLGNIGYIPQSIFMIDSSIKNNIAFGVSDEDVDEERVWRALREAQLEDFVNGLPDGLNTGIGERGIRISGGQRQRIGIARALYEDPKIMVLDEATSALDGDTEEAIMDSVNILRGKKTLIIIAHRLQTIEKCDMVYRVEDTKLVRER